MNRQISELSRDERELYHFNFNNNMGLKAAFSTADEYLAHRQRRKTGRAAESDLWLEQLGFEWHGSAALQTEFIDPEIFIAFKRAEAQGRIGIVRSGAVTFKQPAKRA